MLAIGTGIVVAGVAAVSVITTLCGVTLNKVSKTAKKFDKGVREMQEITVKDIQTELIKEAVNRAAEQKVGQYVALANQTVLNNAKETIHKEVDAAVKEASHDIVDKVSAEISERAAQIDMEDLKRRVRDKAEEKVLQKFDGNLQDILDKFSGNLGQIQRIYTSIGDTLRKGVDSRDNQNKVTFSLNN